MNRLIVVSNRLPFALDSTGEDLWTVTPAVGGLVSAIEPVLRERLPPNVRGPGIAAASRVPRPFAINVFPAHPLSAVRYFFEASATTAASARAASVRFARVSDAARCTQLHAVRPARDAGRKNYSSPRPAINPL